MFSEYLKKIHAEFKLIENSSKNVIIIVFGSSEKFPKIHRQQFTANLLLTLICRQYLFYFQQSLCFTVTKGHINGSERLHGNIWMVHVR